MINKPNKIIMKLEKSEYAPLLKSQDCIPDVPVYITNTVRGYARYHYNGDDKIQFISIPKHIANKPWSYTIYYIAHELAHINNWNIYKSRGHNKTFYECFKQLCPNECQDYELSYKPSFGRYQE